MALPKRLSLWERERLEARHAVVVTENSATSLVLAKTLQQYGYRHNEFIAEFERAYGGLEIPEMGSDQNWREEGEPAWLFGAYGCLISQAHVNPRGGLSRHKLIPVVYSPNDVIYFLDYNGRAFVQDTIEESKASLYAPNARAMLCRILVWDEIFYLQLENLVLEFAGLHGHQFRKLCDLKLFKHASANDLRFWGNAEVLVVEILPQGNTEAKTLVASRTKQRLDEVNELFRVWLQNAI